MKKITKKFGILKLQSLLKKHKVAILQIGDFKYQYRMNGVTCYGTLAFDMNHSLIDEDFSEELAEALRPQIKQAYRDGHGLMNVNSIRKVVGFGIKLTQTVELTTGVVDVDGNSDY
jgi:hypothetical protein